MTSLPPPAPATAGCPRCGAVPAAGAPAGRFCAECGAPFTGAICAGCASALTPGARFCHRCGTAVGAVPMRAAGGPGATAGSTAGSTAGAAPAAHSAISAALPWTVAGIALVALIAMLAGQRFNARPGGTLDAPLNALPQAGLDGRGVADAGGAPSPIRAPDISNLSDRERAGRLFDRVMRLTQERDDDSARFAASGKTDSLQLFAQMGIQAYMLLEPRDADVRYDMGRIAEVAGAPQLARVQADSILRASPSHLLGLALGARSARSMGDEQAARDFERRLLAAEPAEGRRDVPEYKAHANDIATALETARRRP